jgi:hypothetical protein
LSEFAEALGLPEVIRHKGKDYQLAPADRLEVAGEWENYLEDCAWQALERRRPKLGPAEYREEKQDLLAEIAGGTYSLYEKVSWNAMRTPFKPGFRKMIFFRLKSCDPDMTEALAAEIADEQAAQLLAKIERLLGGGEKKSGPPGATNAGQEPAGGSTGAGGPAGPVAEAHDAAGG